MRVILFRLLSVSCACFAGHSSLGREERAHIGGLPAGTGTAHQTAGPTESSTLVDLGAITPEARDSQLSSLVAKEGSAAEVEKFLTKLRAVAQNPDVSITLVFETGQGPIKDGAGRTLTRLYLSDKGCSTRCDLRTVEQMAAFPLERWMRRQARQGASINDSSGICGELTVLHGLVRTGMVPPHWAGVTNGANWNDAFVERVWRHAGRSTSGTGDDDQRAAFQARWMTGYEFRCGPTYRLGAVSGFKASLQSWCEHFAGQRHGTDACKLAMLEGGANRRSGHAMLMKGARWRNGKCEITVVNTGVQGNPTGQNVPREPGEQIWEIGGTFLSPVIRNVAGGDPAFWNNIGYRTASAFCCGAYHRPVAADRAAPKRPDAKGEAWND